MFWTRVKNDGGDVVEALYPLSPLVPLPTHIEHVKVDLVNGEARLENALREDSAAEEVLVTRGVVCLSDLLRLVEKVLSAVDELIFVAAFVRFLHARVAPQPRYVVEKLVRVVRFRREVLRLVQAEVLRCLVLLLLQ